MPQDRESGAAGRAYGLSMGRAVASLLGADKLAATSNEAIWSGKRVVIKACAPANGSFGVTATMLPRLDAILVASEREDGSVSVHEVTPELFREDMRDSRSTGAAGRVKLVRKRVAEQHGRRIARFTAAEIKAATAAD